IAKWYVRTLSLLTPGASLDRIKADLDTIRWELFRDRVLRDWVGQAEAKLKDPSGWEAPSCDHPKVKALRAYIDWYGRSLREGSPGDSGLPESASLLDLLMASAPDRGIDPRQKRYEEFVKHAKLAKATSIRVVFRKQPFDPQDRDNPEEVLK